MQAPHPQTPPRRARPPRRLVAIGIAPLLLAALLPARGAVPTRGGAPPECAPTLATEPAIERRVTPVPATPDAAAGTPVAAVDGIALDSYGFVVDDLDGLWLRAEVVNTNPFAVHVPQLELRLLDRGGREVELLDTQPLPAAVLIPPGGRMPMYGYVMSDIGPWEREEIRLVPGRPATERDRFCAPTDLRVEGVVEAVEEVVEGSFNDRIVRLFVRGEVVNDGPAPVRARAHLVFSDASGRYVANAGGTRDTGPPIPAGGRGSFEVSIPLTALQPGWTYRVMITAKIA